MKTRVAILDDEQRMVDIIGMVLRREGWEVQTYTAPDAALAVSRSNPATCCSPISRCRAWTASKC